MAVRLICQTGRGQNIHYDIWTYEGTPKGYLVVMRAKDTSEHLASIILFPNRCLYQAIVQERLEEMAASSSVSFGYWSCEEKGNTSPRPRVPLIDECSLDGRTRIKPQIRP